MLKAWTDEAWADYLYWQAEDRKILKRINALLKDIDRNGNTGLGKPEPLKYEFRDYWSRRITEEHRLVYRIEDNGQQITIISCRKHYE
jgi:toxin YoeB